MTESSPHDPSDSDVTPALGEAATPDPAPIEPEPPGRTPNNGWVSLILVFGFIIGLQFIGYLGRNKDPNAHVKHADNQVRAIVMRDVSSSALNMAEDKPERSAEESDKELKDLVTALEKKPVDASMATFLLIVEHELKQPANPKYLKMAKASGTPRRIAAFEIYSRSELTLKQATDYSKPFKGDFFVDTLAKIHAHELAGDAGFRQKTLKPSSSALAAVGGLLLLALVGIGLIVVYVLQRGMGRWTPLGAPIQLTALGANANAARTSLLIGSIFAIQVFWALVFRGTGLADTKWGEFGAMITGIAVVLWLVRHRIQGLPLTFRQVGLHTDDLKKNVLWGVGAALANVPILMVALFVGMAFERWLPAPEHPVTTELSSHPSLVTTIALAVMATIFAPITEEITFRGVLLPALLQKFKSPYTAMWVNGAFFAMIHPTGVPAWPALAALGALSSLMVVQRGSLVPSIAMHATHNAALVIGTLLSTQV